MVGSSRPRTREQHSCLSMVQDRVAYRLSLIPSAFICSCRRPVFRFLLSTSAITETPTTQMATSEWARPNIATSYRLVSGWHNTHKRRCLPLSVDCPWGAQPRFMPLANGMLADGLLLFDPMLNTRDALERGGWVGYGLPPVVFRPMAYLAPLFWSLPYGQADALNVAKGLGLPISIVQNRDDPITRAQWSQELAETSAWTSIEFAPKTAANHDCLADKGRWGTHASAFHCHPNWTMDQVEHLLQRVTKPAA